MKLFNNETLAIIRKKRTAWITSFVLLCVLLLTSAVLSAVFYKQIGRAGAQALCTVCIAAVACLSLIFADYIIYYKKITALCAAQKSELTGFVKFISEHKTTYCALPFIQVVITTEDNQERNIYLYEGLLKTDVRYKFEIARNVICSYEEIQ